MKNFCPGILGQRSMGCLGPFFGTNLHKSTQNLIFVPRSKNGTIAFYKKEIGEMFHACKASNTKNKIGQMFRACLGVNKTR